MKTAILTGASGFVGGAVLRELLSNGYKVYAVVREGRESTLPAVGNCIPVFCDLSEISSLKDKIPAGEAQICYHFAWAGVSPAQRVDTRLQLKNAQWSVDCLRVAKELGCSRFVCAGSIMEHEAQAVVLAQGHKPGLGYIYGSGKMAAHAMCKSVAADIGIDFLWVILTNVYGVGDKSERMVNSSILKCLRGESPQFTKAFQIYDFIYIDDVAHAFLLIGEKGKPFIDYMVGSGEARPLREFLLEMKKNIAPQIEFIFGSIPFTGIDLPISVFDCSRTTKDTGFRPVVNFGEGCRRARDWWQNKLEQETSN